MDSLQDVAVDVAVRGHLTKEWGAFQAGDAAAKAKALAGIAVLMTQFDDEAAMPEELQEGELMQCIEAELPELKKNAVAVLNAMAQLSQDHWRRLMTGEAPLVARMVSELPAAGAAVADEGMVVNALGTLALAAQAGEEGASAVLAADNGLERAMQLCSPSQPPRIQETAADVLCSLASHGSSREVLIQKDAVTALGALLGTTSTEVAVRALMGLGMLLPGSEEQQARLAAMPGAVGHLMALVRQDQDPDCKLVARDILSLLIQSPGAKDNVEAALRA